MPSIVDKSSIIKVCVDDFALRKRFSYGTVMVDLESHRIIDMIPSRDTSDVMNWLTTFPNIEVVSRDGAITYSSAVTNAHPKATQISDRFHLIKGLSEVVCKYIIREFPARVEIPLTESISEEMRMLYTTSNRSLRIRFAQQKRKEGLSVSDISLLLHSSPTTIRKYLAISEEDIFDSSRIAREQQHLLAQQQKRQEVNEARRLAKEGYPLEQIAITMNHAYKTIQRYLDPNYSVTNGHYNVRIPGKLAPYEQEVLLLRSQGIAYSRIHAILSAKGYTGSVASLRMFVQKERTRRIEQTENSKQQSEFVQRKSLCQLIYKSIENVATITEKQYIQVLKKYPLLSELYVIVKDFYAAIFSKAPDKLDLWMTTASHYQIPELQTFLTGIAKSKGVISRTFTE